MRSAHARQNGAGREGRPGQAARSISSADRSAETRVRRRAAQPRGPAGTGSGSHRRIFSARAQVPVPDPKTIATSSREPRFSRRGREIGSGSCPLAKFSARAGSGTAPGSPGRRCPPRCSATWHEGAGTGPRASVRNTPTLHPDPGGEEGLLGFRAFLFLVNSFLGGSEATALWGAQRPSPTRSVGLEGAQRPTLESAQRSTFPDPLLRSGWARSAHPLEGAQRPTSPTRSVGLEGRRPDCGTERAFYRL